jgi:signal transduction histidine kinase
MINSEHQSQAIKPEETDQTTDQHGTIGLNQRVFLTALRHDLQTPLHAIMDSSKRLLADVTHMEQEEFRDALRKIQVAEDLLLTIVNEALDPAKLENDPIEIDLEVFGALLRYKICMPFNTILGYSNMLQEHVRDFGQADLFSDLQKIRSAAEHFLKLTTHIANFSKYEKLRQFTQTFLES